MRDDVDQSAHDADPDSPIEAMTRRTAEGRTSAVDPLKSWVGGRLALIVAGIG